MQHSVGEQVYEALRRPGRRLCPCQTSIYRVRRKGYKPIVILLIIIVILLILLLIFCVQGLEASFSALLEICLSCAKWRKFTNLQESTEDFFQLEIFSRL